MTSLCLVSPGCMKLRQHVWAGAVIDSIARIQMYKSEKWEVGIVYNGVDSCGCWGGGRVDVGNIDSGVAL